MSKNIFKKTSKILRSQNLKVIDKDIDRPWGGFFVISEDDAQDFSNIYFNGLNIEELKVSGKLSPKILIIAPNKRLSWQYHHRRSEIWKVVGDQIKVVTSHDDIERKEQILKEGDEIRLSRGERHRIIGMDEYAVVAEIWIHTDKDNPSDENDIVRVQDDFDRN
jgi:mannose-6-phosphate isomerase-like protein (cupin superfamily)